MTIGVATPLSPPLLLDPELWDGGQSTSVGGQVSPPPDPDESSGGGHPEPAPKSDPVQSALATAAGNTTSQLATAHAERPMATDLRRRLPTNVSGVFTATGCPRRR